MAPRLILLLAVGLWLWSGCGPAAYLVPASAGGSPGARAGQQAVERRFQEARQALWRAAADEEAVIRAHPDWAPAHARLAAILWEAGQPKAALAEAQVAAALDPASATDGDNLAWLALKAGQPVLAQQAVAAVLARHPADAEARVLQAQLAERAGDRAAAVRALEAALLAGGPQGPVYEAWGRLYQAEGRWNLAAAYYLDAQAAAPGWWRPPYDLAVVAVHQGRTARAVTDLKAALADNPLAGAAWTLLDRLPRTRTVSTPPAQRH
ncbi:TPR_REGION domain-containing protein [Candidatus Hydrogenisulfobacillus filiaventi]|uniref:TPR_REGION domain-containing protein n=1 Tax=Candidatus Hydrogenisulfobacillus filiaventi TaxID=2707344 RepID=A0A6F8ZG70_9FIRM|nr:hypothetical protein [Bacillota bacterium]CAB1128748.1 TPR_REGION domain-containing protein [Candidatus Hydrogenisulfobacillus filiaventi]